MPSAWATSAIGRPASTRSKTLRRNSGGYPRRPTPLSSQVEWHGIQQRDSTEVGEDQQPPAHDQGRPRALRSQLVQSANTARKLDPQLAAVYHAQMTQGGATHRKALCVVAARLAERAWLTMAR